MASSANSPITCETIISEYNSGTLSIVIDIDKDCAKVRSSIVKQYKVYYLDVRLRGKTIPEDVRMPVQMSPVNTSSSVQDLRSNNALNPTKAAEWSRKEGK